jgi:hypothetical protein
MSNQIDDKWFDNFIDDAKRSKDEPITVNKDGEDLKISIQNAIIEYMVANRFIIVKVGRDTFKQFLLLLSKGQDIGALRVIYEQMDTSDLIDKYRENAVKLAEVYKQEQETRAFWLQLATSLGGKIITLALGALI